MITLGARFLEALGLKGRVQLEINTLGDQESRDAYRTALVDYLRGHRDRLSDDSKARLERNPLRVLDSKDEGDREIVKDAPVFTEYLNELSRTFFDTVLNGLEQLGIEYVHNPRLVRGLDYYSHTAFEFTTTELGAQGTVLAGGRYDGLVKTMGGPPTPGIGWAAGVERLALLVEDVEPFARPIAVVPLGAEAEARALGIADDLRRAGYTVDLGYGGNMKKRMQRANKINACAAVILGEDELARGEALVRDLDSGEQTPVRLGDLEGALGRFR